MSFSLVNILSIIIAFQLALLILFLVSIKKGKRISNILLACFFLLLLLNITDGLLSYYGFYILHPGVAHLEDGLVFLLGPVLFFYTLSVIYQDFVFNTKDLVHIIPFITITVSYQLFYHFQTEEYQKMIQGSITHQTLPPAFYVSAFLIYGHIGVYILLAFRQLNMYRSEIRKRFSSISKINLEWLTYLLGSILGVLVISVIYTFLPPMGLKDFFEFVFTLAFIFVFLFVSSVVWKALRQPEIFAGIEFPEKKLENKYQSSNLTDSEKHLIVGQLNSAMQKDKLFLNPDLSLDTLAAKLDVTSKKLSQTINETFNQNFFEYINTYRIEEAKQIFENTSDSRLTVLEVMYDCGFNSKSSFNTIFKAKTGITPSEYKKRFSGTKQ